MTFGILLWCFAQRFSYLLWSPPTPFQASNTNFHPNILETFKYMFIKMYWKSFGLSRSLTWYFQHHFQHDYWSSLHLFEIMCSLGFKGMALYTPIDPIISYALSHIFHNIVHQVGFPLPSGSRFSPSHLRLTHRLNGDTFFIVFPWRGMYSFSWCHSKCLCYQCWWCQISCFLWGNKCFFDIFAFVLIFTMTHSHCVIHKLGPHFRWCCHYQSHSNNFFFKNYHLKNMPQ